METKEDKPISSLISGPLNPRASRITASSEPTGETALPELSETEQAGVIADALEAARHKKAKQQRDAVYWQRIHQPHDMPDPTDYGNWILSETRRYDEQGLNPRYVGEGGYVLDENSQPVFDLLCMYFSNNSAFEKAGQLYDQFGESKFSLKKGIALLGPTGCGKTTLLWLFCDNPRQSFTIAPCKVATDNYESAPTSPDARQIYDRLTGRSDVYGSLFRQGRGGRGFDDLGIEPIPVSSWGKKRNLMLDVLERRYDAGADEAGLTHLTTNLSPQQIEDVYGKRLRSRMREMFNLIKFDPKTPDRRE